jgi:radical SAM superfamily enzyme YgiQ (UPF0313 family)
VIKSGVMYYPMWLAYATGLLEKVGFRVRLVDAPAMRLSQAQVLELASDFSPRLVAMETSTPSIHNDIQVAEALKASLPGAYIVLVGPHVSALPEETLRASRAVDAVARGEYDETLLELAQRLEGGGGLEDVAGLSFRDATSGEIVHNPQRAYIKDLDALPFVSEVYLRHLRIKDYFYSITRYPEVAILTGRGCPYQCVYCVWPQTLTGHGYRRRSVGNVADEFEFISRELPEVKEVFIEDDTLTVDARRSKALAEELIRRGNRLPFSANSRADASEEALLKLKAAGLRLVCVGFESGDQGVLDCIQKRIQVQDFYTFREAARRSRVLVHGCFMAGNPGETPETLQKTLDLALALKPDTAQFFPVMIYPGTSAFRWAQENGYLATQDYSQWLTSDGLHRSIVQRPGLSAEDLAAWCDHARQKFYLQPGYVMNKLFEVVARPQEARRIIKAAQTFSRYLLSRAEKTHF